MSTTQSARRALAGAIVVLALACPSALGQPPQLPDLTDAQAPLEDGALGELLPGSIVENVANDPLPAPVEEVVSNSPAAPAREKLRRLTGDDAVGGGGAGGDPAGGGSPSTSTTESTQPRLSGAAPGDGENSSTRRSRHTATRRSPGAPGGAGTGRAGARRAAERSRQKAAAEDAQSPLAQTIEKIVEVVPTAVWLALGVLLVLAAALGSRAFVERRRARELESDRQRLIRDVGALERALLPAVPETLGALAASVAHRASEGPAAGGDFYDAFELPGGRVAVLVGDVSGHGPDALERTNSLRAALHGCLEAGLSPRAALESVGRSATIGSSGQFATVVVAVHDPADGTLTYATAGHPPPIIAGRGAHEPVTTAASPPIGLGLRTGLRETVVPLPADTVACLSPTG